MNKRFTRILAAFALLVGLTIPMGMWGQTRAEEVYSTCLFGSDYNSQSVSSYTATWTATNGDYTWTIVNGNNNNNAWSYVKFGRKNNASVGEIKTTEAYEQAITKVDLTIDAITANNVNSIKLYASTGNDTWTEVGSFAKSSGLQTVTVASPAADQYYKIEFDCASGSSNGLVTVSKVEYYYNTGGASSPTISADNVNIAYNVEEGEIEYSITNPVEGGSIAASTTSDWLEVDDTPQTTSTGTIEFICDANPNFYVRPATIVLTYKNSDDETLATKNVTVTQALNPNGIGSSQSNPYTVAQARVAIDAAQTIEDAFVTGVVSQVDSYNSTYHSITYWISDDGTTSNQLEAYSGISGIEGWTFNSKDDIVVGATVVIYGKLKKFNDIYEFDLNNQLVSYTAPAIPTITINPNTLSGFTYMEGYGPSNAKTFSASGINLTANMVLDLGENSNFEMSLSENGTYTSTLTLTQTEGIVTSTTIYVRLKADKTAGDFTGTITLTSGTTNVSVTLNGNVTAYVAPYATLPFSFNGGKADIATTAGLTQEGLGSDYSSAPKLKFDNTGDWLLLQFDERPGELSFDIKGNGFSSGSTSTFIVQTSADGTSFTDLATYTELGDTQNKSFDNLNEDVRYIKWIYTEKGASSGGNVALGNISLAKYVTPTNPTVNIGTLTHVTSLEMWYFDTDVVDINNGDAVESGTEVFVLPTAETGYSIKSVTVLDANGGQVSVTENSGNWSFFMPNSSVTINVTATQGSVPPVTGDKYELYTGTLVEGDYLIVYDGGAMNTTVDGDRLQYEEVSATNNVIVTDNAAIVWHIAPSGQYWTIYNADADAYAASTGAKNKAQMLADGTDDKALWTVSGTENYEFVNKANSAANVNANLRKNGTYGFACYATGTGGALSLYKKVPTLDITGYGTSTGGYYLIASPVSTTPADAGMITDDNTNPDNRSYDLYYFDQSAADGKEWINYRQGEFGIEPGKGYLYANKNDVTLTFTGTPYNNQPITLTKTQGAQFEGWNLIGNPYATAATPGTKPFYRMNGDGSGLNSSTETGSVNPMEGIFVVAETDGETVTFTQGAAKSVEQVVVNLTRNRGTVIDNAIVRFDGGDQLPKFQLFENSTKLYIQQGNKDYAIVRSAAEAEMPVSFRASENGTYTLAVEAENVEMNYLHLIDNLTGMDVDLLQTPSYTFEAKTSDYASRFRLVFKANSTNENNAEAFAYFNGTNWTVSNVGDATLQVVDVTGRTVANQMINGNAELNLNQPAGVYVIRLVNGDNVKTQKVVVR